MVSPCRPFIEAYIMKYMPIMLLLAMMTASCDSDDEVVVPETPEPEEAIQENQDAVGDDPTSESSELYIDGRYLKNKEGNIINLHGYTQTYSPYFNNGAWTAGDVASCLAYNQYIDDGLRSAGWKFNFVRLHMDPVWSDDPTMEYVRFEGHERFSYSKFVEAFENVFLPMAEYYIEHGEYVVMRPPGVCPETLTKDDTYFAFLCQVWKYVSAHERVRNNMKIMFELANEPVRFDGDNKDIHDYFQGIVDRIRKNCDNIIWVPGMGYQSQYQAYAQYPIEGGNIGYAVHCYPGWYGSYAQSASVELGGGTAGSYEQFQKGWDAQVGCVAEFAPIMVTEIDWAPLKYNVDESGENKHLCTWGSSTTTDFGSQFRKIADNSGNVSWLLFTTSHHRYLEFVDQEVGEGNYTFMNDPEACPWAIYHWFQKYDSMY